MRSKITYIFKTAKWKIWESNYNLPLFPLFRVQGWDLYRKWMIWQVLLQRYASIDDYANKDGQTSLEIIFIGAIYRYTFLVQLNYKVL